MSDDTQVKEDPDRELAASRDADPDGWLTMRGPQALAIQAPLTPRSGNLSRGDSD